MDSNHTIGIIIASVNVAIIVGLIVWRLVRHHIRGPNNTWISPINMKTSIGVHYEKDAAYPWPGFDDALLAIVWSLRQSPWTRDRAEELIKGLNIRIVPHRGVIITFGVKTGFISADGRRDVPPPATHAVSYKGRKVTGSVDYDQALPLLPKRRWVVVRQLRENLTREEDALGVSAGPITEAGQSALFYEVATRYVPWMFHDNPRHMSRLSDGERLQKLMEDRYAELRAGA